MDREERYRELQTWLRESPVHVWVLQYGISHHVMLLAVHKGDYLDHTKLICGGCSYFSGPLQGGPYSVDIEHGPVDRSYSVCLRGNGSELVLRCESIEITHETFTFQLDESDG